MDHEETLMIISAMRRQEETEYFCRDYLNMVEDPADDDTDEIRSDANGNSSAPCDATCRQIMFYWMVRVVDFFPSMTRETVAYAMSYLDRFLQSKAGADARRKRSVFQLAAISCLYMAVKIHESSAVSPQFLEKLSQAEYTVKDVEGMELTILAALGWRMSTPTALAFLRQFMAIIPKVFLNGDLREEVFQIAKYQTEVALSDYKYVTVNGSTVAYCALLNALDMFQIDSIQIGWFVSEAAQIVRDSIYTIHIQQSLARDHVNHATLKGSPVSAGYEHAIRSSMKVRAPSGHNSSPRTVCNTA
ncbi:diatom-specific cyclin [Seminavis robusta]|uniref:Diatom-specific cyclin n=1 Tax=Seminavis robusta TaxID=568900 RepID=A0A9N8DWH5_9STRA|nr:diatom-specific cyclin [Seminavis robusta]|eukprot:Sro299_g111510.1 diatom-specific cyclin (303) ;mRNA; f:68623-69531